MSSSWKWRRGSGRPPSGSSASGWATRRSSRCPSTCRSAAAWTGTKPATKAGWPHPASFPRLETMTDSARTPTQIDTIADAWVDTIAEQLPTLATYIGRSEYNDRYGDYSPEGMERLIADGRATLSALEAATPVDEVDVVTKEDLSRELRLEIDLHEAKWNLRDINVIASPVQDIRSVLDLMPTDTADDWNVISTRLKAVPQALDGYVTTLREGIAQGIVPARRQVLEVVTQIARYTSDQGFFATFAG